MKEELPRLIELYETLLQIMRRQWREVYKPFGYEVLCFRMGGLVMRIKDIIDTLQDYCDGKISRIPELEEELLTTQECALEAVRLISASEVFFNPEIHN